MLFSSVRYLLQGENVKIVVFTKTACEQAKLVHKGKEYGDCFNDEEPYDKKTHIFYIPQTRIRKHETLVFSAKGKLFSQKHIFCYEPNFADENELKESYRSQVRFDKKESETIAPGVQYTHFNGKNKDGAPVHYFLLEVETKKASLYIGTPDDGYESKNVKAKVPEMIEAAVKNGVPVVAAVNADFFDMFGDCHPSGLCVKNGKVIANENSLRPFIGIRKDGTPVMTDISENPTIVKELSQAAAGLEMIVKDGKLHDWGPLEPFSYVCHPRTAVGLRKDGTILLLVADGRIPEYSNGATLVDLAEFMIAQNADRAVNFDGGGSSIVYTKSENGFMLRNNPADLVRPRAKLIRKEFDALLVTARKFNRADT